ncbi:hypothetical protein D3C72_1316000 [compost metagenome]
MQLKLQTPQVFALVDPLGYFQAFLQRAQGAAEVRPVDQLAAFGQVALHGQAQVLAQPDPPLDHLAIDSQQLRRSTLVAVAAVQRMLDQQCFHRRQFVRPLKPEQRFGQLYGKRRGGRGRCQQLLEGFPVDQW